MHDQRKKKPEKGEVKSSVENLKEKIRAKKRAADSDDKFDDQTSRSNTRSVHMDVAVFAYRSDNIRSKQAKPTYPSGLVTNWQAKVKADRKPSNKAPDVSEPLGGLQDDDIAATPPHGPGQGMSTKVRYRFSKPETVHLRNHDHSSLKL